MFSLFAAISNLSEVRATTREIVVQWEFDPVAGSDADFFLLRYMHSSFDKEKFVHIPDITTTSYTLSLWNVVNPGETVEVTILAGDFSATDKYESTPLEVVLSKFCACALTTFCNSAITKPVVCARSW